MKYDYIIIGAGVAGCVAARILAEQNKKVLVVEKTTRIGGQTYDEYMNGVLTQKYGIHILYTDSDKVVRFLSRFTELKSTKMTASSFVNGKMIPLPINFHTLDAWFGEHRSKEIQHQLLEFSNYGEKMTFGELDVLHNGTELIDDLRKVFDTLFVEYSKKQWQEHFEGNHIIDRIPITIGYEDYYLPAKYHTVPNAGYTAMFTKMLDHINIQIMLNTDYRTDDMIQNLLSKQSAMLQNDVDRPIIINTTRIDEFYNFKHGKLDFRSLDFQYEFTENRQDVNAIHFPVNNHFIRTVDCKTVYQQAGPTMIVKEIPAPCELREPFYTVMTDKNIELAQQYALTARQNRKQQVIHLGRAAEYKYYRMDELILRVMKVLKND